MGQSDKQTRVRKPKDCSEATWDFYYQQFSEPGDEPDITLNIEDDCYTPTKDDVKRLRKFIRFLDKAANYLESKI